MERKQGERASQREGVKRVPAAAQELAVGIVGREKGMREI